MCVKLPVFQYVLCAPFFGLNFVSIGMGSSSSSSSSSFSSLSESSGAFESTRHAKIFAALTAIVVGTACSQRKWLVAVKKCLLKCLVI